MAVPVQGAEQGTTNKKPLTKQRRVVVTGLGVVSPVGHDPDVFYNSLLEGVSGISEIEAFDCARFPTVDFLWLSFILLHLKDMLTLVSFQTENCWRNKVFLNRWMGLAKAF